MVVIGGREYGTGGSRDWTGKRTMLLGVRAVVAESYAHPPLQLGGDWRAAAAVPGWRGAERLGLTGGETYDMTGTTEGLEPGARVSVNARREDGSIIAFEAVARLDSDVEVEYYRNGGILPAVLRRMATE